MKPLKSICESSFGAGCSKRCHGCAASLAALLIRPFLLRTCPIVLAAGGRSPRFSSTRRILRAFQTGCASRTSRILRSIAASVLFGECSGRRERSSYVSLSSAPRSIHLYAVLGDTPYRRHNSRTFAPGPLARLTNSRRRDTIDTSLHPIAASCHEHCSGAVNVSTMSPATCPPCPRYVQARRRPPRRLSVGRLKACCLVPDRRPWRHLGRLRLRARLVGAGQEALDVVAEGVTVRELARV